ncbi:MAG: hypothetical protein RIC82_04525, partial [Parvibaculum sp.]
MSELFDKSVLQSLLEKGTGKGIRVAMLDTGADEDHPELAGWIAGSYDLARTDGGYECVAAK